MIGTIPVYLYRWLIRPLIPRSCRFSPTCSQYAIIAIRRHGMIVGWQMALWRVARCNPFHKRSGGYDPVRWGLRGGAKWVV